MTPHLRVLRHLLLPALLVWPVVSLCAAEPINLAVPEGGVVAKKARENALAAGSEMLAYGVEAVYLDKVSQIKSPFRYPQAEVVEAPEDPAQPGETAPEPEGPAVRQLSDREVLAAILPSLQRTITGTMIMGSRRLLLREGNMKPISTGFTFKTRVSPEDPNTYTITITDIQPKEFTIKLNETDIRIPIGERLGNTSSITPGK